MNNDQKNEIKFGPATTRQADLKDKIKKMAEEEKRQKEEERRMRREKLQEEKEKSK